MLPTMPLSELVQELHKREDSLDHLMAKAEITRRQTQAQLDACAAQERACASQERNARYSCGPPSPLQCQHSRPQGQWALQSTRS